MTSHRGGSRILEWGLVAMGQRNFKWGAHTWHTLIITVDADIRLTSN